MNQDPTLCISCGKPHWLRDEDVGSDREELRLCIPCFKVVPRVIIKETGEPFITNSAKILEFIGTQLSQGDARYPQFVVDTIINEWYFVSDRDTWVNCSRQLEYLDTIFRFYFVSIEIMSPETYKKWINEPRLQ